MNPRNWILIATWFLVPWSWAPTAVAQSTDPAGARALFQEARKAAAANDFAAACPKFAESYVLEPAVGTLLNIADCDKRQGRIATAWSNFQRALEQLPKKDARRAPIQAMVAELEHRLPRLSVGLNPSAPASASLERDGVAVGNGSFGVPIPVDPGRHVVVVKTPGHQDRAYEIDLQEAEQKAVLGEPGPAEAAPTAAPRTATASAPTPTPPPAAQPEVTTAPAPAASRKSRVGAYVLGGVGVAGIAVGVILRVQAFGKQSTIDTHCPQKECDPTGWDAVSSAKTLQTASGVALIAGAATLGVGIYLGVSTRSDQSPRASLHPLVVPGGGGVSWLRRF